MSLSDIPEVQQFWEDYEKALTVNRRIIETQVVRQAVEAIGALELELSQLQERLEDEQSYTDEANRKLMAYNPLHFMEE